jgi:SAM-dependent methyltransferase
MALRLDQNSQASCQMSLTSYTQSPYKTFPRKECDPTRLCAIARLYGVEAAAPSQSRVLELGCGSGANLVALAERFPQGSFLGVDFAQGHIDEAQAASERLGLTNVEWICADIKSYAPPRAEFDYIIVHGLYSWVNDGLRARILSLCKRSLSPHGVALVSYNVLPGWRQRGAVRDVMQVGARLTGGFDSHERLESGKALLRLVASVRTGTSDPYGAYLREASERLESSDPSYLVHEYLDDHNDPCLFADFAQRAASEGLQFLAEAKVSLMSAEGLGPDVASVMRQLSHDIIAQEQVLDLCRNRMFRETILCHDTLHLQRDLRAAAFKALSFRTVYRAQHSQPGARTFTDLVSGRELQAPDGIVSDILAAVGSLGAFGGTPEQIKQALVRDFGHEATEADLVSSILTLWRSGFVEAACDGAAGSAEKPRALGAAREQAALGYPAVSFRHEALELSPAERQVVRLADGTRNREALIAAASQEAGESRETVERALGRLEQLGFFA